jgi:hypothetical protein
MHKVRPALSLPLLVALFSCNLNPGGGHHEIPVRCGDLGTFDVSSCDLDSLAQVDASGIWNVNMYLYVNPALVPGGVVGGETTPGLPVSWNLDEGKNSLLGGDVTSKVIRPNQFFLSTSYGVRADTVRFSFMGCSATAPGRISGMVKRCNNGVMRSEGNFEAVRIERRAGELEGSKLQLVSEVPFTGVTADVYVADGYAYVSRLNDGVSIVDVHDQTNPRLVTHFANVSKETDYFNDTWVKGNVAFVSGARRGLVYYDVTNPASPVLLGSLPSRPVNVHTTFIDGNILYAQAFGEEPEVLVVDITDPRNPVLRSRYVAPEADVLLNHMAHDSFALNGRLYINYWGLGLTIADTRDPNRLVPLGRYSYTAATSHASAVGVFGSQIIAFEGGESWDAHLRVIDVTDPARPSLLAHYSLRPEISIHNMILDTASKKLYIAYYQDGVRVLDVSQPTAPKEIAYYNTWRPTDPKRGSSFYEGAIGMRVPGDGYIYVTDTNRGLLIFREVP